MTQLNTTSLITTSLNIALITTLTISSLTTTMIDREIDNEVIDKVMISIREMISRYIILDHDTDQMHYAQDIRVREEANEAYVTVTVVDIDRRVDRQT